MTRKQTIGMGLAALLAHPPKRPGSPVAVGPAGNVGSSAGDGEELAHLPLDLLQRGKFQPRIDMRSETLQELADSIKAQGVVQPIVVRPLNRLSGAVKRYEIIAGERRWRAAQLAGLSTIPAVIRDVTDKAAVAMALIENIQREDLNPLEEARSLERLVKEFELTHAQAAEAVGRSRAAVTNLLRLLELAPEVTKLVERRELEMGHARALAGLADRKQQSEIAQWVVKKRLSVRKTESLVRQAQRSLEPDPDPSERIEDPNVQRLRIDLSEKLGAKVAIEHASSGKGRLIVAYNSLDELDGILAHIH